MQTRSSAQCLVESTWAKGAMKKAANAGDIEKAGILANVELNAAVENVALTP